MKKTLILLLLMPYYCASEIHPDTLCNIYAHQNAHWEMADYVEPQNFSEIFKLDQSSWPLLPDSHEWRILPNGNIKLYKHAAAKTHAFDFITYAPSPNGFVNFTARWDSMTFHSFTSSRNPAYSNAALRSWFPIGQDGFKYNGSTYERGHCHDFADTSGLKNAQNVIQEINHSISTLDPRSYIPEPPRTFWGRTLRNRLASDIRDHAGAYAQYVYYDPNPPKTMDGTSIPAGVFFQKRIPGTSYTNYHIPWNHPIHSQTARELTYTDWKTSLSTLESNANFSPYPFVHNQRIAIPKMDFAELPLNYTLEDNLSYEQLFTLKRAADHELRNVAGKVSLVNHMMIQPHTTETDLTYWTQRLLNQAAHMDHDLEMFDFIPTHPMTNLLDAIKRRETFDTTDEIYDHLYHIQSNQIDGRIRIDTLFISPDIKKEIKIETPEKKHYTALNLNNFSGIKYLYPLIDLHISAAGGVRLLNIKTPRAKTIAKHIKQKIDAGEFPDDVEVEYQVSTDKKWNVEKNFSDLHIIARRIDFNT